MLKEKAAIKFDVVPININLTNSILVKKVKIQSTTLLYLKIYTLYLVLPIQISEIIHAFQI